MRLIDADALVKELSGKYIIVPADEAARGVADFMGIQIRQAINNAPTIEAVPKHAYVIVDEDGNMECSNCGSSNCFDNYCGHCGAKLIGERKDEVEE